MSGKTITIPVKTHKQQYGDHPELIVEMLKNERFVLPPSASFYKITPIKERNFAELLIGALKGVEDVLSQYRVGSYIMNFFAHEPHRR